MNLFVDSAVEALHMCVRTVPILTATLIAVDVLRVLGVMSRLSFIVAPIARAARLSKEGTLALIASVGSTISADSMTAGYYREGRMRGRDALLSAQANTIPAYLRESFTYFLPIIIPLLGVGPGILYVSAFLMNAAMKIAFVLTAGRWITPNCANGGTVAMDVRTTVASEDRQSRRGILAGQLRKSAGMILRITSLLFAASFVIIVLDKSGLLSFISVLVKPTMAMLQIPESLFVPICGYIASPTAGAAALGTMYKAGEHSLYCTAAAALIGGILSLTVATVRYSIPRNIAMFGPKIGGVNVAVGFGLAFFSRALLIIVMAGIFLR